jgi:glutamine amidotransferase
MYAGRAGTTDSEALFLLALARGGDLDPVGALAATLAEIRGMMAACGACEPLRLTAAWTDGSDLHAFRWASDDKAPTLYWREVGEALYVVSEPLDDTRENWQPVPQAHVLRARKGEKARLLPFDVAMKLAA